MEPPIERRVVYCRCGYSQEIPAETRDAALSALAESPAAFEAVCDLCELAAGHDPALADWARDEGLQVVACHPRAVRWLFHAGGAELADAEKKVVDMKALSPGEVAARLGARRQDAAAPRHGEGALQVVLYEGPGARALEPARRLEVLAALLDGGYRVARSDRPDRFHAAAAAVVVLGEFQGQTPPPEIAGLGERRAAVLDITDQCGCGTLQAVDELREKLGLPEPRAWVPWFPAIDYDRCAGCRQCADFCLFGVYEVSEEGAVRVVDPAACKTNCPACARVCPQVAIVFPKYPGGPIDGAEVDEAAVRAERAGTDLKQRLRGDVYDVLRRRGARADGPEAPGDADLEKLAKAAHRSPNVLMSLNVVERAAAREGPAEPHACGARPDVPCCQGGAVSTDCCKDEPCSDDEACRGEEPCRGNDAEPQRGGCA